MIFFCEKCLFSSQMELKSGCRLLKCCSVYPDESSVVLTGNDFRNHSPYFVEKTQILFFSDNFQVHIEKWWFPKMMGFPNSPWVFLLKMISTWGVLKLPPFKETAPENRCTGLHCCWLEPTSSVGD